MTIRAITRYLQRLAPRYTPPPRSDRKSPADATVSSTGTITPLSPVPDSPLTVGAYDVPTADRVLVYRVLFHNTLRKVKAIVQSLQAIQGEKKQRMLAETADRMARAEDYQASTNLFHIQQISHKLVSEIQTLEDELEGKR